MSQLSERIEKFKSAAAAIGYVDEGMKAGSQFKSYEAPCTGQDFECPDDEREYFFAIGPSNNFNTLTYLYGQQKADLFEAAFNLAHAVAFEKKLVP